MRKLASLAAPLLGVLFLGAQTVPPAKPAADPYVWLEDVHGKKQLAWVQEQNKVSLGPLKADPRYATNYKSILDVLDAQDRIPYGSLRQGWAYNFWQDAKNPKGVWRRTSIAEYQKPNPKWDVLLDVDALAKQEKENWVYSAAQCTPSQARCLISLSRGGGDAVVVREFDLKTRKFDPKGFSLPEAKSDVSWLDEDTVLFGTDFGKGSLTTSGYPRIVKQWKRGTPIARATTLHEGKLTDVGSSAFVL